MASQARHELVPRKGRSLTRIVVAPSLAPSLERKSLMNGRKIKNMKFKTYSGKCWPSFSKRLANACEVKILLPTGTSSFPQFGRQAVTRHRRSIGAAGSFILKCESSKTPEVSNSLPSGRTTKTSSVCLVQQLGWTEKSGKSTSPLPSIRKMSSIVRSLTRRLSIKPGCVRSISIANRLGNSKEVTL